MLALSEAILRLPAPNRRRLVFQALALAERGSRGGVSTTSTTSTGARRGRPPGSKNKPKTGGAAAATSSASSSGGVFRTKGPRRTVASLKAQANALHAEVQRGAGRGIEALAKALGTSTGVLALPMKMLLDEGRVSRTGTRRGTKYAVGRAAAPAKKTGKRGRPKKKR